MAQKIAFTALMASILISFIFMISLVLATHGGVPGVPHQFFGEVTVNGGTAADGLVITAQIDGVDIASTTTSSGKYGFEPNLFLITDHSSDRVGKEITFFVSGVNTGESDFFVNGGSTQIDFSVSVSIATPSGNGGGGGSSGGGGGGGGSSSVPPTTEEPEEEVITEIVDDEVCEERWECTEYSTCINGLQTRSCTDSNACGTADDKPLTSQPCTIIEDDQTTGQGFPFGGLSFTGLIAALTENPAYIIVLVAVIALLIWYFFFRKGSKKKGKN